VFENTRYGPNGGHVDSPLVCEHGRVAAPAGGCRRPTSRHGSSGHHLGSQIGRGRGGRRAHHEPRRDSSRLRPRAVLQGPAPRCCAYPTRWDGTAQRAGTAHRGVDIVVAGGVGLRFDHRVERPKHLVQVRDVPRTERRFIASPTKGRQYWRVSHDQVLRVGRPLVDLPQDGNQFRGGVRYPLRQDVAPALREVSPTRRNVRLALRPSQAGRDDAAEADVVTSRAPLPRPRRPGQSPRQPRPHNTEEVPTTDIIPALSA
jgi:hypothetical protein